MTEAGAALFGALIGSLSSVVTMMVSARIESNRQRKRLVYEVAVKEWETHAGMAERILASTGKLKPVAPLITYLDYNSKILDLFDAGKLTKEKLEELNQDRTQFLGTEKKSSTSAPPPDKEK